MKSISPANEQLLVESAREGCVRSMGKLIEQHQREVRLYVSSRVNDAEDALDLTQDVFVTAFVKFENFQQGLPLSAWLKGIAMNKIRNYWRKSKALPIGGIEELETILRNTRSFNHKSSGEERLATLKECIKKLKQNDKELIQDRYLKDQSVATLREKLGVKHSAVTMRLYRIREQLRQCVQLNLNVSP